MSTNATTMRNRLDAHGVDATDYTPKALLQAYGDLVASLGGRYRKPTANQPAKTTEPTPAKPTAPAKPAAKQAPANCACGCGAPTITAKAAFLSGHDARHAGVVGRTLAANPADETAKQAYERMSDALKVKTDKIRATAVRKIAEKAGREAAKAAAKQAYADALATATATA